MDRVKQQIMFLDGQIQAVDSMLSYTEGEAYRDLSKRLRELKDKKTYFEDYLAKFGEIQDIEHGIGKYLSIKYDNFLKPYVIFTDERLQVFPDGKAEATLKSILEIYYDKSLEELFKGLNVDNLKRFLNKDMYLRAFISDGILGDLVDPIVESMYLHKTGEEL